jgi:imidazolonepropionase-like amidohydrolase
MLQTSGAVMTRLPLATCAAALIFACLPAAAFGQSGPPSMTLVRAGNLFDSEAGRMVGPRDILIRGRRIVEVGQGIAIPDGATVIDLSRCSVVPGLIDGHAHLLLEEGFGENLSDVAARDQAVQGDVVRSLAAARRAREYLHAGFTSVRDLGNSGRFLDLMLEQGIRADSVPGPRIYGSGPGLAPAGGQLQPQPHDPHHLVAAEYRVVNGVEDARAAVRDAIARGAEVIKIFAEATPQRTRLSVEEMTAIVAEAKRHGVPVAAHATRDEAVREAVDAGVTSIEHAYQISDDTLRLMAAKGVWLVPTDVSLERALELTAHWPRRPSREEVEAHLETNRDRIRRARRLGVRVAMGSDAYGPYEPGRGAAALRTLDAYVDTGLTPAEALQTATWEAGRMLGDDGLGALRANAWADLVAVEGDPTQGLLPLRAPRLVMKAGRIEAGAASACAG